MALPAFLALLLCLSFHPSQQHMLPNSEKIKEVSLEWLTDQMPAGRKSFDVFVSIEEEDPLPIEENFLSIDRDFVISQDLIFVGEKSDFVGEKSDFPGEKLEGDFVFVEEDSISDEEKSDSKGEKLERDFVLVEDDSIFAGEKSDSTEEKSASTEEKLDSTEEKSSSKAEKSSSTEEKSASTEEKWAFVKDEPILPEEQSDENFVAGKVRSSITDILEQNGLPIGLLPDSVQSFSVSDDGQFEVQLDNTCYAQFDYEVYYGKAVKGKIGYGKISNLSGIQAKELFFWVSVTGIRVDIPSSGYIYFDVGPISKRLSLSQFQQIPDCRSRAMEPRSFLRASDR